MWFLTGGEFESSAFYGFFLLCAVSAWEGVHYMLRIDRMNGTLLVWSVCASHYAGKTWEAAKGLNDGCVFLSFQRAEPQCPPRWPGRSCLPAKRQAWAPFPPMSQHWMKTGSWRFVTLGTFCSYAEMLGYASCFVPCIDLSVDVCIMYGYSTGWRQDHEGLCPQALFVLIFHGAKILGYTSGAMCIYIYVCIVYRNSTGWRKIITVSVLRCFLFLFSIMLKCCGWCLFCATCRYNCISLHFVTDMYSHLCLPLV